MAIGNVTQRAVTLSNRDWAIYTNNLPSFQLLKLAMLN
jgi:hypothetical protein